MLSHDTILALAGRRIDASNAEVVRFPLGNAFRVGEGIKEILQAQHPRALVCSAACGADLLALKAAGDLGVPRHIVLPFEVSRFRQTSVVDRPGDWGPLFDRIVGEVDASRQETLTVLSGTDEDDAAYARVNQAILDKALQLAGESSKETAAPAPGNTSVLAVTVWDGASRGEGDLTAAFAQEARRRGLSVVEVLTT